MVHRSGSYLQEKLEADIHRKENRVTLIFQKEKIKLDEVSEINFLKDLSPLIQKEIMMENDELSIVNSIPESFAFFSGLKASKKERLMTAYQLVQQIQNHSLSRLHLIVCPENIVFDQGLTPHFIHFGVKESLPPYEKDKELLLKETKAAVAALVDSQYTFKEYLKFTGTLKLSPLSKMILEVESLDQLSDILNESITETKENESFFMKVSKKKWKMNRYVLFGVTICLIPALLYSIYSLFFMNPKQDRVVAAQESFLLEKYSDVVTELQPYEIDEIPKVSQYQLALSYVINESLTEVQKENVRNTVSLQSDPLYYEYWINIGRGNAKDALEVARFLEDRDLILFGLLKYREQVKADGDLDSEERQQELNEIESEISEYEEEMKTLEEESINSREDDAEPSSEPSASDSGSSSPSESNSNEQQKKTN
ncbi:type VII secretion protein EssB [Bacillus sp. KH172YL63]|uniref:type VII secretion protein EssB n=1 Tax=Bacillus sp. KH172YL63 TaxID=2709784 RepID=UPI0013E48EED|nr:type VII secretion protein EssB [Bacillus sp. KH172YL63]BCB06046.1 ESX secretion system protein YukC [Bacillus sp. KH172YL63]